MDPGLILAGTAFVVGLVALAVENQLRTRARNKKIKAESKAYVDQLYQKLRESPPASDSNSPILLGKNGRCVAVREGEGPYAFAFLAQAERLGARGVSLHNSPLTDEFTACFLYEGYRFAIDMMWGGELCLLAASDVPEETFERVLDYLRLTPGWSLWHTPRWSMWRVGAARYRFERLPHCPPDSWYET